MKLISIFTCSIILLFTSCKSEPKSPPQTLFNKDFNWTITIPKNYTSVNSKEWKKKQQQGVETIEEINGATPVNMAEVIFVFKKGENNYLEANHQPFDTLADGSYAESVEYVNEILYDSFSKSMPNTRIDHKASKEMVSGLEFYTYRISVNMPNGIHFTSKMYSRLFDKEEFTVNIMYTDKKEGKIMMDAWKNSTFK